MAVNSLNDLASRLWRWRWWLWTLIAFTPGIVLAVLVAKYAVDIGCWDVWENAPLLEKWKTGTLRWADLYAAQIQHRIVVPRLIIIALHTMSGGDFRWEIYFTFAVLALSAILVWRLLVTTLGSPLRCGGAGVRREPSALLADALPDGVLGFIDVDGAADAVPAAGDRGVASRLAMVDAGRRRDSLRGDRDTFICARSVLVAGAGRLRGGPAVDRNMESPACRRRCHRRGGSDDSGILFPRLRECRLSRLQPEAGRFRARGNGGGEPRRRWRGCSLRSSARFTRVRRGNLRRRSNGLRSSARVF